MPPSEVRVAYTLYPAGSADLQAALEGVNAQFPLRNLHWKSSTRPTLRTMQEVDVRLVDLKDVPPGKETVAGSVLESPLVHVCFVCCDVSYSAALGADKIRTQTCTRTTRRRSSRTGFRCCLAAARHMSP